MQIAFTSLACPDWPFERMVTTAADLGYTGIELRFIAGSLDLLHAPALAPEARATTLASLRERQVALCCLDSSVRLIDADADKRAASLAEGEAFIERAQLFGVPFVRVFGDRFPPGVPRAQALDWAGAGL